MLRSSRLQAPRAAVVAKVAEPDNDLRPAMPASSRASAETTVLAPGADSGSAAVVVAEVFSEAASRAVVVLPATLQMLVEAAPLAAAP